MYITPAVPYTMEMLCSMFKLRESVVEAGLRIFQELKMIVIHEDSAIEICNFDKHQSLEVLEHKRALGAERAHCYIFSHIGLPESRLND